MRSWDTHVGWLQDGPLAMSPCVRGAVKLCTLETWWPSGGSCALLVGAQLALYHAALRGATGTRSQPVTPGVTPGPVCHFKLLANLKLGKLARDDSDVDSGVDSDVAKGSSSPACQLRGPSPNARPTAIAN
jgi:hypothetical protein